MNIDEKPKNKESQRHGYWEYYYNNGKVQYKGYYINSKRDGLWEWYYDNGQLKQKEYYI